MGFVAHSPPNYSAAVSAYGPIIASGPVTHETFVGGPLYTRVNGVMNMGMLLNYFASELQILKTSLSFLLFSLCLWWCHDCEFLFHCFGSLFQRKPYSDNMYGYPSSSLKYSPRCVVLGTSGRACAAPSC
jgi:hypothetical protein